jgi:hypothetical protein
MFDLPDGKAGIPRFTANADGVPQEERRHDGTKSFLPALIKGG